MLGIGEFLGVVNRLGVVIIRELRAGVAILDVVIAKKLSVGLFRECS